MDYEVQAAVSALGYLDGEEYRKEADCYETVKDLIRYLRRDGENRAIRKYLGESNIVENDLVPILTKFSDDLPLFDATLRLLINLTQPTAQCYNGKIPSDAINRQIYIDVNNHLKRAKHCFTKESLYTVLYSKLDTLLKLDWENCQEEDKITIERLLILIKNILAIPPAEEDQRRTDTDITLHDQILWALHRTGIEKLILSICESDGERQFHLITLEIVALMVKDHKPEDLARAGLERSEAEKMKDEGELNKVHEMDRAQKFANLKRFSGRHTNFAGSYVVNGLKSIVDNNDVVSHKVVTKNDRFLTMDERKKRRRPPKNRAPLLSEKSERKSALTVRLILKEFCRNFLERCYNYFSTSVRQLLGRNERRQHSSEFYFMNLTKFFIEFSRFINPEDLSELKFVLESISVQTFHYVLMQMNDCMEMMKVEKFETITWGKRFHNAFKTFKELYTTLAVMEKSSNEEYIDIAMEIKKHVFYVVEYGEFFVDVLKHYNPAHLSKICLADLIECVHIYMKLFETHCQIHGGGIKVQKKKRKRKTKQKNMSKKSKIEEDVQQQNEDEVLEQKENSWALVSGDLSHVLQGHADLPTDAIPFDSVAEHGFDERIVAKVRIQENLKKGQADMAVALIKVARELWPDDHESFGSVDVEAEDEFMLLRNIFFADYPKIAGENCEIENDQEQNADEDEDEEREEDDETMNEELDDAEDGFVMKEVEFTFLTYLQRFAHCDILTWYIWLLNDFESNSLIVNHSILKLFHRICYQLKSAGLLYQASLFRVFQKVSNLPSYKNRSSLKELVEFARHFLSEFFIQAAKNRKIFVEILFRKNTKEIYEIEYGYGSYKTEKVKKAKREKSKNKSHRFVEQDQEERIFEEEPEEPITEYEPTRSFEEEKPSDDLVVEEELINRCVDEEPEEPIVKYSPKLAIVEEESEEPIIKYHRKRAIIEEEPEED